MLLITSTFLIVAADLCTVVIAAWMEALSVTQQKDWCRIADAMSPLSQQAERGNFSQDRTSIQQPYVRRKEETHYTYDYVHRSIKRVHVCTLNVYIIYMHVLLAI